MRSRTWLTGLGAGSLLLVGIVAADPLASVAQQDATPAGEEFEDRDDVNATPVVGTPLFTPGIDLIRAQAIALEAQPNAFVVGVELEGDDGVLVYEVELSTGEVKIDATSGEVLESEQDDDNDEDEDNDDEDQS